MRTMVAILFVSATYSPAATGRAVMYPSNGARIVVSANAFSACASCAFTLSSDACEVETASELCRAALSLRPRIAAWQRWPALRPVSCCV